MWSHLLYTVVMANKLAIQQQQLLVIAQYLMEIFVVFDDGLSKYTMAAMVDGVTSTDDLPPYVLDSII